MKNRTACHKQICKPLLLAISITMLLPSLVFSQCKGGKDKVMDENGTPVCPEDLRKKKKKISSYCSILVTVTQKDGVTPLAGTALRISHASGEIVEKADSKTTDDKGSATFPGLLCEKEYQIIPTKEGFEFPNLSIVKTSTKNPKKTKMTTESSIVAIAVIKPEIPASPKPKAAPTIPPCPAPNEPFPSIIFDKDISEPKANCLWKNRKYSLQGVIGGEKILIELKSENAPTLRPELFEAMTHYVNEVKPVDIRLKAKSATGWIYEAELPNLNNFSLSLNNEANEPVDYSVSVNRVALSNAGYDAAIARVQKSIVEGSPQKSYYLGKSSDSKLPTLDYYDALNLTLMPKTRPRDVTEYLKAETENLKPITLLLEELKRLRNDRHEAFAMLLPIYLYFQNNLELAAESALQTIRNNGDIRFRTHFGLNIASGPPWLKERLHHCWLTISKSGIKCEDFTRDHNPNATPTIKNDGRLAFYGLATPSQIKRSLNKRNLLFAFTIHGQGVKEPKTGRPVEGPDEREFDFIPFSPLENDRDRLNAEAKLIKDILLQYPFSER